MLKKILIGISATFLLGALGFAIYQNTQSASAQEAERRGGWQTTEGENSEEGQAYGRADKRGRWGEKANSPRQGGMKPEMGGDCQGEIQALGQGKLDNAETEGLLLMREEEKLARDVYLALYDTLGLPIFQNIASSEQSHMDAVKKLLDAYNLEDPASEQKGVFTNEDLQELYNTLVAQGNQSIGDALTVGGAIEEIDILDLERLVAETDNADIQQVYNNLLMGSKNHLRAFSGNYYNQTGETYQPQYMSVDAYEAIVNAAPGNMGHGNGNEENASPRGGHGMRGGNAEQDCDSHE